MALIGKNLALASVGIACQTAHQIELHHPMISHLAGEDLEAHGTPFDWLLAPVSSVAQMIQSNCFYPADISELSGTKQPYWPRMGVHFWHHKFDDPAQFSGWGEHVVATWQRLREAKRKIFIISNTQNNIAAALMEAGRDRIETRLLWEEVFRLFAELARAFGEVELHVVTTDRRAIDLKTDAIQVPWASGRTPIKIHKFEEDPSKWVGNAAAWQKLFQEIVP